MQKQNQKLIRYAREITEHKESEEKAELELKTKEYNEKLDMAFKQMDEFKAQREKHEQMFEEICKQRDAYKQRSNELEAKLQHYEEEKQDKSFQLEESEKEKSSNEALNALSKLQKRFDRNQTEMMETNRMLNADIDKLRQSLSEMNTKYALSESKLEGTVEKCKTLNSTVEKYKKECEIVKERNSKFSESIIKHEQSLNMLNQELHKAREKQGELEAHLRNVTIERDLFKSNQERLSIENQLLTRENQSRALILQNLETIKNSCDRNERENKFMYHDKIEGLEKENTIMRKRLETDEEQKRLLQKSFETQLKELNTRLETELKEREKTREQLRKIDEEYAVAKNKLVEVEAKLHSSEQLIQMTRNAKSSTTISRLTELEEQTKDLQMKLSLNEKEIVNLKIQLEDAKLHAKQYSTIADNMEKTYRESTEASEKAKKTMEQRIGQLEAEKSNLQNEFNSLTSLKNNLEIEIRNEKETNENRISALNGQYASTLKELNETREKLNQTEIVLNERTRDRDAFVAQIRILEEQNKNETEEKNSLKSQVDSFSERIRELNEEYSRLQNENSLNIKLYAEKVEQLSQTELSDKEKYESLENENKELIKQINVLQDELTRLSENIQILQKDTLSASFKTFDENMLAVDEAPSEDVTRRRESTVNLLEINRFLREQKEQLEKNYQNISLEHEITVQRLKKIENEHNFIKEKTQLYENEIESLKIRANMNSNVNNDDYNLIIDTNRHLKEQFDSVTSELNELNEKIKDYENDNNQIKTEKCSLEIENETLLGEKTGMQMEIKRWKDRVDALLRESDIGDEWIKAQKDVNDLQEQSQTLTDMINELRKNLAAAISEKENLQKDCDACKASAQEEKNKISQELENLKQERQKKEDLFKIIVTELKTIVIAVQKELEINNFEWVKLKNIKEELGIIQKAIMEKLKAIKDDVKNKNSSSLETEKQISELNESIRRLNEDHLNKVKELENSKKQLHDRALKAIETSKEQILKKNQKIEELTNSLNEANRKKEISQLGELNENKSSTQNPTIVSASSVADISTSTPAIQQNVPSKSMQSQVVTISLASGTSSSSPALQQPTGIENQQSAPPTAYIAPSRVNKITPLNTRPNMATKDTPKRTAAVHPTPHESSKFG